MYEYMGKRVDGRKWFVEIIIQDLPNVDATAKSPKNVAKTMLTLQNRVGKILLTLASMLGWQPPSLRGGWFNSWVALFCISERCSCTIFGMEPTEINLTDQSCRVGL